MKKIVHIHTDIKFIHGVDRFDNKEFDNKIIILGSKGEYKGVYKDSVQYYDYSRNSFHKIISLCKRANMVVLYDLNFAKAYIANRLPKSIVVVWRFFGTELYSKMPNYVFSEKTLEILKKEKRGNFFSCLKKHFISYLICIKYFARPKNEVCRAAFSRADFFLGLSKIEYDFLKSKWPKLPSFIQLNLRQQSNPEVVKKTNSNLIILGNNKSSYNNHLDIIDGIKSMQLKNKFKFMLLVNYGSDNKYSRFVKKEAGKLNEIQVVEKLLPMNEFHDLYATADAFVMNGHRQMAMGNIFEALRQNTKIYLNKKNVIFSWLRQEGFIVFTIEDFFSHLRNDDIALSQTDAIFNQERFKEFIAKYNKTVFQETISLILNDKL